MEADVVFQIGESRWSDTVSVHDLLLLRGGAIPSTVGDPPWLQSCLETTLWAVVRRDVALPDHIPVGIRGYLRHERWATYVHRDSIDLYRRPETLRLNAVRDQRRELPPFRTLDWLECSA